MVARRNERRPVAVPGIRSESVRIPGVPKDVMLKVLNQNATKILRNGGADKWLEVPGTVDGVVYQLGVGSGRIGQFFPAG
jgi:hypothetical protein